MKSENNRFTKIAPKRRNIREAHVGSKKIIQR